MVWKKSKSFWTNIFFNLFFGVVLSYVTKIWQECAQIILWGKGIRFYLFFFFLERPILLPINYKTSHIYMAREEGGLTTNMFYRFMNKYHEYTLMLTNKES